MNLRDIGEMGARKLSRSVPIAVDEERKKKMVERRKRIMDITKQTNNYKINIVLSFDSILKGSTIH